MIARMHLLAAALALAAWCARAADPTATVGGAVNDEGGRPLAEVKVQVCGLETLHDGTWTRVFRLGWMPSYSTDQNGRFVLPFHEPGMRYDLYFDKVGYAPAFLHAISSSSPELSVVMKRGLAVTGTVKRLVGGKLEPVSGTTVELRLPYVDLWYQQRTLTDNDGRYTFRVTPPPAGRKWQVAFADEVVPLEVSEGKPVVGPDFKVEGK
jgi:hypothetical protein